MNNPFVMFEGSVPATRSASQGPSWKLLQRAACIAASVVALASSAAMAAEPVQVGPTVTVNASKDAAKSPSETAYVEAAYKKLQGASRYPSSREASLDRPSGTTTVWANVGRDGRVKSRGVEQSSGSPLLDGTAKNLIGRSRFPAFTSGDWDNAATHRFVVSYAFDGTAMTAGKGAKAQMAKP